MEEKRRSSCKVFCRQVLVAVCNGSMFALSSVWILAGQQQEYGKIMTRHDICCRSYMADTEPSLLDFFFSSSSSSLYESVFG